MLIALMDGRALTASELADVAGVALPTASSHLGKLVDGSLLSVEKQGRHRYYRLAGADVAHVLETLMLLADRSGHGPLRTGPSDPALREARVCYDHLAGARAVALYDALVSRRYLELAPGGIVVTSTGRRFFSDAGIDVGSLAASRRPVCRVCLDWSARRHHLAGSLGAAILDLALDRRWARREKSSRIVTFSATGGREFARTFRFAFP